MEASGADFDDEEDEEDEEEFKIAVSKLVYLILFFSAGNNAKREGCRPAMVPSQTISTATRK